MGQFWVAVDTASCVSWFLGWVNWVKSLVNYAATGFEVF